jgi:hypothetical protein
MLYLPKVASISSWVWPTNRKETKTSSKMPFATNKDQKQNTYQLLLSFQQLSNYTCRIGGNLCLGTATKLLSRADTQASFPLRTAAYSGVALEFSNNNPEEDASGFSRSRRSFATDPTV